MGRDLRYRDRAAGNRCDCLRIYVSVALLMFALTACGNSSTSASNLSAEKETETSAETSQMEQAEEASGTEMAETSEKAAESGIENAAVDGRKILVAYFSHTGNTEEVALYLEQFLRLCRI